MSVFAICASHTPLIDHLTPAREIQAEVDECFASLRRAVTAFAPQWVIVFGPDHFNGFFYRLMPAFCVGAQASSIGDWNTPGGELPGDALLAERLVRQLHEHDVDVAISYRMEIDHGLTQTLSMLFDWPALPPVVPIFINCAAPPCPPFSRVMALGRAVGAFVKTLDARVLILGSGGLSHDPPIPALNGAAPEIRERLIAGGLLSSDARTARQTSVIEEGRRQAKGLSQCTPLNPRWDRQFIAALLAQDLAAASADDDATITRRAGRGGHEVRTWLATAAAMQRLGAGVPQLRMYRPIPEWVAGFAVMTYGPTTS